MQLHRLTRAAAVDQRGGVLVMFALFAPVVVLLMSFVLDVGNLFVLHSHLQLQADAGALAAAQDFNPCSFSTITADVQKYSSPSGSRSYNTQVDNGASGISEAVNSQTYPGPVPGTPDDTVTGSPCTSGMVDVKLSDSGIPWYFRVFSGSSINAHARVQITPETTLGPGGVPFAISDPTPRSAAACFVDESSGAVLASTPLVKNGTTWSNASAPVPVTINKPGIAVRVALSGNSSTTCTDPAATLYDTTASTVGLLHIAGWTQNNAGTASKPVARQVVLLPGDASSCSDPYFSDPATACTVGIQANVDFGTATEPAGATVDAVVTGTSYPLTYNSTTGTVEKWTTTTGKFPSLPPGTGPNLLALSINTTALGKKGTVTIANVHSSYTAGGNSGPITAATVSEAGVNDADSFRMCETGFAACTHNLVVTLTIASLTNGPLQHLSVANGGVNCPPGNPFSSVIVGGCQASYTINTGGACNTTTQPYNCVTLQNGVKANQIAAGLNQRILGNSKPGSCTHPNNWGLYPNLPVGDPRILTVFITAYGSAGTQPIEAFATFYLTGWSGQGNGFSNPCQPPPATWNGSAGGDDVAAATTLVGHFMSYVNVLGGGGGTGVCDPTSIDQCTATLTR